MTHYSTEIASTLSRASADVYRPKVEAQMVGLNWQADDAEFNKWYNEQHLPERMAIPGYVSARRFKLEGEGNNNALKYLCIWELEDGSPLQSEMYKDQNAHPTELYLRVNKTIKARTRGLYTQVYPEPGTFFEDRSGFHGERLAAHPEA